CCQLPDAFRRLPRPSSPLTAKASTVCALSLDHITPSRLGIGPTTVRLLASTTHPGCVASKTLVTRSRIVKEHDAGFSAGPFQIFVCAKCNPGRETRPRKQWWVWEDSNHRPHPYQGCALTT